MAHPTTSNISDGFQQFHEFKGHFHPVRHFGLMDSVDERRGSKRMWISGDCKHIALWDLNGQKHQLKFPKSQSNFISAIVFIPQLKILFAAALDMCFKIYDRNFKLIESIRHSERSILAIEYVASKGLLLISGANGVSCWRVFKHVHIKTEKVDFVVEKLFVFPVVDPLDCWISHMIFDEASDKIFALKENSVMVFSLLERTLEVNLENVHDSPVTRACFYVRSQYYLTGCSRGLVKVWASHKSNAGAGATHSHSHSQGHGLDVGHSSIMLNENLELLHTFRLFSKAVTGLINHPIPGLCITAGLDGYIKVLNLEQLTELFTMATEGGITSLISFKMLPPPVFVTKDAATVRPAPPKPQHAIMFAMADGTIEMWKITAYCDFFGIGNARVETMHAFANLHWARDEDNYRELVQLEEEARAQMLTAPEQGMSVAVPAVAADRAEDSEDEADLPAGLADSAARPPVGVGEAQMSLDSPSVTGGGGFLSSISTVVPEPAAPEPPKVAVAPTPVSDPHLSSVPAPLDRCIVSYAGLEIRVFADGGRLLGRLDPHDSVNKILSYACSPYLGVLICLFDTEMIGIFDCRQQNCPKLCEFSVPQSEGSKGTCVAIIDEIPTVQSTGGGNKDGGRPRSEFPVDPRGHPSPDGVTEVLVIGTASGSLIAMDIMDECNALCTVQVEQGSVNQLNYKNTCKQLFTFGRGLLSSDENIKIWKLPEMSLLKEIPAIKNLSAWGIAPVSNLVVIGCRDGYNHLYKYATDAAPAPAPYIPAHSASTITEGSVGSEVGATVAAPAPPQRTAAESIANATKNCMEIFNHGQTHKAAVTGVNFSEQLQLYVTASLDSTIMITNFKKIVICCVHLNVPTPSAMFTGSDGGILISQSMYLLTIAKDKWNQGKVLESMTDTYDPWSVEPPPPSMAATGAAGGSGSASEEEADPAVDERPTSGTRLPSIMHPRLPKAGTNRIFLTENAVVLHPTTPGNMRELKVSPRDMYGTPAGDARVAALATSLVSSSERAKGSRKVVSFASFLNSMMSDVIAMGPGGSANRKRRGTGAGSAAEDPNLDGNGMPRPKPPEQLRVRRVDGDKRRKGVVLTFSGGTYTVSELHQDGMSRPQESVARRIANIGMSPRARNALLNSRPPSSERSGQSSRSTHKPLNLIGIGTEREFDCSSEEEEEEEDDGQKEEAGGAESDAGPTLPMGGKRSRLNSRVVGPLSREGSLSGDALGGRGSKAGSEDGARGEDASERGEEEEEGDGEEEEEEEEEAGAGFADVVMRMRLKKAMRNNPLLQKIRASKGKPRETETESGAGGGSWIQDSLVTQNPPAEEEDSDESPPPEPVEMTYGSGDEGQGRSRRRGGSNAGSVVSAGAEEEGWEDSDDENIDLSHRTARLTLGIAGGVANMTHNAHEMNSKNHIVAPPKKKKNSMVTPKAGSKRNFRRNSVMVAQMQMNFPAQPPKRR